jgi:hypothetical protein
MGLILRVTCFPIKALILSVSLVISTIHAETLQHPYVLIPDEGELTQDNKLTKDEWEAIILAVNHSIDRVKAAMAAVDRKNFNEARSIIRSSLHLLTLVKIATPTFEIVNHAPSRNYIRKIDSLLIKVQKPSGEVRIIDVLLMKENLENALLAMDTMNADSVRLFLMNASKSSWRYEKS